MSTDTTASLTSGELGAIEGRLDISGLFTAHAHTDVTRLLAEIHRLRHALADQPADDPTATSRPVLDDQGARA